MLLSVKNLRGYTIRATDGEIGKVHEFYFDDESWTIRYLVVDTGHWLSGRKTLISPTALCKPDKAQKVFPVLLTKDQVENSPNIDTDKPVSRQQERELREYYKWPVYWVEAMYLSAGTAPLMRSKVGATEAEKENASLSKEPDSHLRSTREVIDYKIQAVDGEIGHVEDFIADDENWVIRYMAVNTRNWLPGKKVLVSPQWVEEVSWKESDVHIDLTRKIIKNAPEFDASAPVNREYEEILYDYYGRPKYWV